MHSLTPYTIRVFDNSLPGKRELRYHKLDNIRKLDFLNIFHEFAKSNNGEYQKVNNEKSKITLKFTGLSKTNRSLSGWIEHGEYGIKGKVVNVISGKKMYDKQQDDSDIHLYYFNLRIPNDESKGILLLHNIHGRGVKGVVEDLFKNFFLKKTLNLKPRINPFSYEKAVEDWMKNAKIKELRLSKFNPKTAATDVVDTLGETTTEMICKPKKKGGDLGSFWDLNKTKNHTGKNRQAVDILDKLCHSIKAVVVFQGKKRIFSLSSDQAPISSIEFTEEEVKMDQGQPDLKSLHTFAEELIDDISKDIF